jgi:hypothetical protein
MHAVEKPAERHWLVPLHQHLHILVRERVSDPLLSGWCEREGALHVVAPAQVLEKLVAVRIHLDESGPDHGALGLVPGCTSKAASPVGLSPLSAQCPVKGCACLAAVERSS